MRRYTMVTCVILVAALSVPTSAAAGGPADSASDPSSVSVTVTTDRTPGRPDTVEATVTYRVPGDVDSFRTRPLAGYENASVVGTEGFVQLNETVFRWDGSDRPSITVRVDSTGDRLSANDPAVERDGWALVAPITPLVSGEESRWLAPQLDHEVAGEGYPSPSLIYLGNYSVRTANTSHGAVEVVVPAPADPVSSPRRLERRLVGNLRLFHVGVQHDRVTAVVLPPVHTPAPGWAAGDTFYVADDIATVRETESAVNHEYVHTRMGVFGSGSSAWLTEATASYYDVLLSVNQGTGSYRTFRSSVRAPGFAPNETAVVLSDPDTWTDGAPYEKGAHVLAALDAEIRRRTDGERTLLDVLRKRTDERYNHLRTYGDFRRAVVDTVGEEGIGAWLDRYVTTEALPPIPDDPWLFVMAGTTDADREGLPNAAERPNGTNPLAADTDSDRLNDSRELSLETSPRAPDTDGDSFGDGFEVARGTDPGDDDATPSGTPTAGSETPPRGSPDGTAAPDSPATTGEVAAVAVTFFGLLAVAVSVLSTGLLLADAATRRLVGRGVPSPGGRTVVVLWVLGVGASVAGFVAVAMVSTPAG